MSHIIFDGSNLLWRAHWVSSQYSNGYSHQDINIFLSTLHSICHVLNCYQGYIAWDDRELRDQVNPRRTMNQDYKQNRTKHQTSVYENVHHIKQLTTCLGFTHVRPYALEGDDVISVLCDELSGNKFIVSADMDLAQLVSPEVYFYSITKKVLITPDNFLDYFPVTHDKFLTYKCVIGDTSDNISGVPGYGVKKGALLTEKLHQDASAVSDGVKQIIQRNRQVMDLKYLITPEETQFIRSQLAPTPPDIDRFRSVCHELRLQKALNLNLLNFILN